MATLSAARTSRALPILLRPCHPITQNKLSMRACSHSKPRYQAVTYNEHPAVNTCSPETLPTPVSSPASTGNKSAILSKLPTSSLFRSLFINAVSSRPWLLGISLQLLKKLSAPDNMLLFNMERNIVLRFIMKQVLYKQFCAGETPEETSQTMEYLQRMGFRGTILTFAKETVFDEKSKREDGFGVDVAGKNGGSAHEECIEAWIKGTMQTAELMREGDQLALKMTGAGPAVCNALANEEPLPEKFLNALDKISMTCRERGAYILVDAESQRYQWGIFRLGMDLQRRYNTGDRAIVYNTYQAYLKSTQDTLAGHMQSALDEDFTLGIKVVRGAYKDTEARHLIHDTKQDTDDNYNAIAQGVLRRDICGFSHDHASESTAADGSQIPKQNPFPAASLVLASHNRDSLIAAHELHRQRRRAGLPTVHVKFAQLHGMSDAVSFELLRLRDQDDDNGVGAAPEVYKCSTWGPLGECMAYLTRRGMENKDAASRTSDEYAAVKAEVWRRMLAFWNVGARKLER